MIFSQIAEAAKANKKVVISQGFSYYAGNGNWENKQFVNRQYNEDGFIRDRTFAVQRVVSCFMPEGKELGFGHTDEDSKKAWDYYREIETKFEDGPLIPIMRNIITPEGGWHE